MANTRRLNPRVISRKATHDFACQQGSWSRIRLALKSFKEKSVNINTDIATYQTVLSVKYNTFRSVINNCKLTRLRPQVERNNNIPLSRFLKQTIPVVGYYKLRFVAFNLKKAAIDKKAALLGGVGGTNMIWLKIDHIGHAAKRNRYQRR